MSQAWALPRIKTKRKRRKPPRPRFWFYLFWVMWGIFWSVWNIIQFLNHRDIIFMISLGLMIMYTCIGWPDLMHEWKRWKDGD